MGKLLHYGTRYPVIQERWSSAFQAITTASAECIVLILNMPIVYCGELYE